MATKRPGKTPGNSEFSHGKGLMPNPAHADPKDYELLHAQFRTDNMNEAAEANYFGINDRTDKPTTVPVRETKEPQ